ncbi:MAG: hypothetical protein BMS9Abin05_0904 [Rhodothermia bacterium]|nr:MAG: hypothetical protein BMS9Abin05_0904 [Rhodothermia bacterium]
MSLLNPPEAPILNCSMYLGATMRSAIAIFILTSLCLPLAAQPRLFGSIDDPAELGSRAPWLSESSFGVFGGLSLIGPQWRSEARVVVQTASSAVSSKFTGLVRVGPLGNYEPDIDEMYDLVRVVDYVRLQNQQSNLYVRLGPLQRTRLGMGQLVNFHNTLASWDERRMGVEASISSPMFTLNAFADDLNLDGLLGGQLSIAPLSELPNRPLRSIVLSVSGTGDRMVDTGGKNPFSGYEISGQIEAWRTGAFSLNPFISYARIKSGADGYMVGTDLRSDNFIDTARFHFRLAIHLNTDGFVPGVVGPFWQVQNARARIIASGDKGAGDDPPNLVSHTLSNASRSRAIETELRVLLFERFEFWYRFVRIFDRPGTGEFNSRIFVQARQYRLAIAYDRGGLGGFFTLFNDLGDLTLLRFETAYRFHGAAWIMIEARYTYERVPDDGDLLLYEVQRRFDPLVGLRVTF